MGIKVTLNPSNQKYIRTLVQPSLGTGNVTSGGASRFVDLSDVITSPANTGDIPIWNSANNTLSLGVLDGGLF